VLRAAAGDVLIHVCCPQACEKEWGVLAVVQVLEDPGEVAGLSSVEGDRLVASSSGSGLFGASLDVQLQGVAQRGLLRGCVGGIGEIPLELSERKLCGLEVGAAGRDLAPSAVLVDVGVPDQSALGEPISALARGILDCLYSDAPQSARNV
jgi:hypothetical protein